MEYAMVDATIVKVHRHGQGAKGGLQNQAIGRSKGGMTTKILALTDALGNLVRFVLLPGQRFDTVGVEPLIKGLSFDALIADKAFDSNSIIADLNERGAKIVISQHPRRTKPIPLDAEMYKWRHLIENFFCKLKEFKRIAMRADKTDQSFNAIIHLAAAVINSRSVGPSWAWESPPPSYSVPLFLPPILYWQVTYRSDRRILTMRTRYGSR